jgi:hypothetical protein
MIKKKIAVDTRYHENIQGLRYVPTEVESMIMIAIGSRVKI